MELPSGEMDDQAQGRATIAGFVMNEGPVSRGGKCGLHGRNWIMRD
jgi:hypothetical protein